MGLFEIPIKLFFFIDHGISIKATLNVAIGIDRTVIFKGCRLRTHFVYPSHVLTWQKRTLLPVRRNLYKT